MGTIAENLLALQQAKTDIKTALENKGQDLTDVPFTEYGNKIAEMSASENLDTELNEQETLLNKLEEDVNALSDKPTDMLQTMVDQTNSCAYLFYLMPIDNVDYLENLDTSKVRNMEFMFGGSSNVASARPQFTTIPLLNTSNVVSMNSMFMCCDKLTTIPLLDTSNVLNMSNMFYYCDNLETIPLLDTSNVLNISYMFYSCDNLETIPLLDTSKVVQMGYMFKNCPKLTTIPLLNTSNVVGMDHLFYGCTNLINIPTLDTSNVTSMNSMFRGCENLTEIPPLDIRKCTNCQSMFYGCTNLHTVPLLDLRTITSANNTSIMFNNCVNLQNLTLKNIKYNLVIGSGTSYGTLLTNESLINTIKELWDLTGATSQKLTLSTTSKNNIANIYVKLVDVTDEMRAEDEYIDNKKPCVVCESTDEGAMTLTEYAISKNWAIA